MGSVVQSLVFDRALFGQDQARLWARTHGFRADKVDVRPGTLRIRQVPPTFDTYRTIHLREGVQATLGIEPTPCALCQVRTGETLDRLIDTSAPQALVQAGTAGLVVLPEHVARAAWDTYQGLRKRGTTKEEAGRVAYGEAPRVAPADLPRIGDIRLMKNRAGIAVLGIPGTRILPMAKAGYPLLSDAGWMGAPLFGLPEKMAAPAFGLVAGTLGDGGACAAAGLRPDPAGAEPALPICQSCYAQGGNYILLMVQAPLALRQGWVLQTAALDPSGEAIADGLQVGLDALADIGDTMRQPVIGRIHAGGLRLAQGPVLHDPDLRGPEGALAGYVRIHDSGDFSPGVSPTIWTTYVRAWIRLADRNPFVRFWAPTRNYAILGRGALQEYARVLRELADRPNVALRPSALGVGDPPPQVPRFSAGSGVYRTDPPVIAEGARACPVYTQGFRSCQAANCRACWTHREEAVWYRLH